MLRRADLKPEGPGLKSESRLCASLRCGTEQVAHVLDPNCLPSAAKATVNPYSGGLFGGSREFRWGRCRFQGGRATQGCRGATRCSC